MLYIFYNYSKSRKYWICLTCSVIILVGISLLIQHFFLLNPCVLCIYQRCALFGIASAGLIAAIYPSSLTIRIFSLLIWIFSSTKGLYFSNKHINTVLSPSPFFTCDLFINFPDWLPLNKWWPSMFHAYEKDCATYTWYFLSLELSQWIFIIFISYFIIAILSIILQIRFYRK